MSAALLNKIPLSKNSFDDERLKKDFINLKHRFSKPQIKEIRKNVYVIKNLKNLSTELCSKQEIKEIEENLFKLEEHLSNFEKYRSEDDFKNRNVGDIRNLFNQSIDDNNCFQYALTTALNYQNIKSHPERISNLKPFIDQYNWKEIDFPSEQKDWKKFELNNKSIALNSIQDGRAHPKRPPYQLFSCNFYKRRIWAPKLSDF